MNSDVAFEIEERIYQLPLSEQQQLVERVSRRVRTELEDQNRLDELLAAMAADPEIQRELRMIEEEFRGVEADGPELK
jgi:hypothetical protein